MPLASNWSENVIPPAYVVRGKIPFSQVSVSPHLGGGTYLPGGGGGTYSDLDGGYLLRS